MVAVVVTPEPASWAGAGNPTPQPVSVGAQLVQHLTQIH